MKKSAVKGFFSFATQKRITTVSGAWVYYFLISLIPLAILVVSAFSVFNVSVINGIVSRLPEEFRLAGATIVQTAENASKGATVFFGIAVIFSCTSLLNQMSKDGDFIYGVHAKHKRGLFRRVWALFALAVLFLLLLALALVFAFGFRLKLRFFLDKGKSLFLTTAVFLVAIFFGYVIIYLLNKFISPVKLRFNQLALGSLASLFIMISGTVGFTLYLRVFADYNLFYGSLAGIIAFLIWAYILMFGLSFGVMLNVHVLNLEKAKATIQKRQVKENYVKNNKSSKVLSKG